MYKCVCASVWLASSSSFFGHNRLFSTWGTFQKPDIFRSPQNALIQKLMDELVFSTLIRKHYAILFDPVLSEVITLSFFDHSRLFSTWGTFQKKQIFSGRLKMPLSKN